MALAAAVAIFMIIPAIRGLQNEESEPRTRGRAAFVPPPDNSVALTAPYEGTLIVPLLAQPGVSPTGWRHNAGGFPYKLTREKPAQIQKVPPDVELLYGVVPLVNQPVNFAMTVPKNKSKAAVFYIDKNFDGDLTNDTAVTGAGDFRSAYRGELPARTVDGEPFSYHVWLWTNINHPHPTT